jgi:hypothetical protein
VYVLIINVVSYPPGALIWKIKYLVSCIGNNKCYNCFQIPDRIFSKEFNEKKLQKNLTSSKSYHFGCCPILTPLYLGNEP